MAGGGRFSDIPLVVRIIVPLPDPAILIEALPREADIVPVGERVIAMDVPFVVGPITHEPSLIVMLAGALFGLTATLRLDSVVVPCVVAGRVADPAVNCDAFDEMKLKVTLVNTQGCG